MKQLRLLLCLLLCAQLLNAQTKEFELYEKKLFISGTDTLRYRILYPENYNKRKAYPLVLFLHGSGERGRDNEAQLLHGGDLFLKEVVREHFKSIVIFPQCPNDSAWSRFKRVTGSTEWQFNTTAPAPRPQQLVKLLVDSLEEHKIVNSHKIYLGGLSLGGLGTYDLLIRYPGYFAAAFPICGAMDIPAFLAKAHPLPLWIFHGALDPAVPPTFDRDLYTALMTRGAKKVLYTEYPKAGHNSWDSAFAEPKLLPWLFSVKKKNGNTTW
jgi:predicted peptidase